jgi:aldehyde dehydrogenase (NAD+)
MSDIYDEMVDRLAAKVSTLQVGDGQNPETVIGPLVSRSALLEVVEAIEKAKTEGAEIVSVTEGVPAGPCFQAPTLFVGDTDLTITREEVFGPVSTVLRVGDEDEAFALANDTEFGLSASVFTNDLWKIDRAVHELQAGLIKVNGPTTGSEIHAPFGGEKNSSGHSAREQGDTAHEFFTRTRTAYIKPGSPR